MRYFYEKMNRIVSAGLLTVMSIMLLNLPAAAIKPVTPADNGDVKTHNVTTAVSDQRDEPKVCAFYLDAFNFDAGQNVEWHIVKHTHGDTVLSGNLSLPTGNGATNNYSLPNGMYKLYWNFNGEHGSAKHKVFKVDCPETPSTPEHKEAHPTKPVVTTPNCEVMTETVTPAAAEGVVWSPNGAATVLQPGQSVTYRATVAAGYDGDDQSWTFTNDFDASKCETPVTPVTPTTPTTPPVGRGGEVLGASTTAAPVAATGSLANTGIQTWPYVAAASTLLAGAVALFLVRRKNQAEPVDFSIAL